MTPPASRSSYGPLWDVGRERPGSVTAAGASGMDDVAEGMAAVVRESGRSGQAFLQIAAGMAGRVVGGDGLRCALGDDGAAVLPTFGSQVHDPVGGGHDIEVVLNDDHRVAAPR